MTYQASSSLVTVAEDAELRLVKLLAETAGSVGPTFVQDCEACISNGDAAQLMRTILSESGAITALVSLDDEAVSAVALLAALLDRAKTTDASQSVTLLADTLVKAAGSTGAGSKVISLLATLYNMRSEPLEKISLVIKMIRLASATEPSLLEPHVSVLGKWMDASRLPSMLDEWKIPPAGRRALYLAAAEGAPTPLSKQQFTLLVVETYTTPDVDTDGLKAAETAAIGAIKDPVSLFTQQRNILALPAIEALGKTSTSLVGLLKVFQEGKLEDYYAFVKSNGGEGVLSQWGLSADDCVRYMRILSLCSLAAEHEEIPYQVVTDTLQTNPEEVEKWVIAAVSSGLLSAKMDQLQDMVVVERCVVRKFDMEQWKAVQTRLNVWKQNVGGILESYRQSLKQQPQ